jgi:ferredoxin-NADP reductase
MLKYLLDNNLKLPITLFYSNKKEDEIVYKDILDESLRKLNIKTIYNLTDLENIPKDWKGYRGRINEEIINKEIKDISNTKFYLSGPHAMVVGFEDILYSMGISQNNIKKDFFPGF